MLVQANTVLGWAIGRDFDEPVRLALSVHGKEVACSVAGQLRPALKGQRMHPTGHCGFAFRFQPEEILQTGDQVTARLLDGDFLLGNSPCIVGEAEHLTILDRSSPRAPMVEIFLVVASGPGRL